MRARRPFCPLRRLGLSVLLLVLLSPASGIAGFTVVGDAAALGANDQLFWPRASEPADGVIRDLTSAQTATPVHFDYEGHSSPRGSSYFASFPNSLSIFTTAQADFGAATATIDLKLSFGPSAAPVLGAGATIAVGGDGPGDAYVVATDVNGVRETFELGSRYGREYFGILSDTPLASLEYVAYHSTDGTYSTGNSLLFYQSLDLATAPAPSSLALLASAALPLAWPLRRYRYRCC